MLIMLEILFSNEMRGITQNKKGLGRFNDSSEDLNLWLLAVWPSPEENGFGVKTVQVVRSEQHALIGSQG